MGREEALSAARTHLVKGTLLSDEAVRAIAAELLAAAAELRACCAWCGNEPRAYVPPAPKEE